MNERQTIMDEVRFYFVVRHDLPDVRFQLALNQYAPFREDCMTLPFDVEEDAALYVLDEWRKGAIVTEQDVAIARAIVRGEQPMFVYEEKQADGTLLLSLHDCLPPEGSKIMVFGSRSGRWLARFLLRRLHESERIKASEET